MNECNTVNCLDVPTTTLRIESDYESVTGETKTIVLEYDYCDEHADVWLRYDSEIRRVNVVGEDCGN